MDPIVDKTQEKREPGTVSQTPLVVERLVFRRNGASAPLIPAAGASPGPEERKRLSPRIDRRILDEQLEPVRKHYPSDLWDESWSLYWLPAGSRRWPPDPRIVEFLNLVIGAVQQPEKHHAYTFLEQSAIHPYLTQPMIVHASQYMAIPMIGIRPEAGTPQFPATEAVKEVDPKRLSDIAQQKNMELRLQDFFPDAPVAVYWIREGHAEARQELSGQGGWRFVLSDLAEDAFFEAAKETLLKNVEDEGIKHFPLIAPLLSTRSFIRATRPNLEAWFRLCPLYLAENIDEKGLTIACHNSLDDVLIDCVKKCGLRRDKNARRAGRTR